VEIKLSTGRVIHGYQKQLEIYRQAADNSDAALLVVNIGKIGKKLQRIQKIQADRLKSGERAADIWVVDATRKPSASKR
jgi:hypothetical protein